MPQARVPTSILEARGSFIAHPERKEDRAHEPVPSGELGLPPATLTPFQKTIWAELAGIIPAGVAGNCDRWIIEIAVKLMAKVRLGKAKGIDYSQLLTCLARLGMTPADRSRVKATATPQEDSWDDLGPATQQ
jgi:hypothetical protein